MSAIDSNSIDICEVCGVLVWWEQIEKHAEWHQSTEESDETGRVTHSPR